MNPNPFNFDSDLDYWDACHPTEAAFINWIDDEGHFEFLQQRIEEVQEYVWVDSELDGMLFAMAVLLLRMVPNFRPLLIRSFHRQADGIENTNFAERLADEVDTRPLIELFLFASKEVRTTWPPVVREAASVFHETFWQKVEKSEWLENLWSDENEKAAWLAKEDEAERRANARWSH